MAKTDPGQVNFWGPTFDITYVHHHYIWSKYDIPYTKNL